MSSNVHRPKIWTIYCSLVFLMASTVAKNGIKDLEKVLNRTTDFFEKLKVQFGSLSANNDTFESIDTRVDEFIDEFHENTRQRSRRQLFQQDDYETESGILAGFETLPNYKIPAAIDVSFFIRSSSSQLNWFLATINPDGVSLLQFDGEKYTPVNFYPLKNGKLILTDSKDFSTLLIIQQFNGIIKVLRLSLNSEEKLVFSQVQTLPTSGSKHAATWTGMNRLYLGVSSGEWIRIYMWLGENFDQIQVVDVAAERLIPLQTGGSMILAAIGSITRIISFQLKSDKFIVTQELKASQDATGFQSENGIFGENFLVLAGENSTIIYKERKHRYVPFQQLEGTSQVQALSSDQKVLLFFLQKSGMKVFQYDGWRFSDLQIHAPRVTQVYPTFLPDGLFVLAMKTCNQNQWSFQKMIWRATKNWQMVKEEIRFWCEASLRLVDKRLKCGKIPALKHPLVFINARINHLSAVSVNGRDVEEFVNITRSYKMISSRWEEENQLLKTVMSSDNPVFTNLSAKRIKASKVIVNNTETSMRQEFIDKLRRPGDTTQNITFKNVKTSSIDGFSCPIPAINYEEVKVTGSVNGVSFQSFAEDTLKTNEEIQVLTGQFIFDTLKADEGDLDLDIAFNSTKQKLMITRLTVDELNVPAGYFLPLNGDDVTMTGNLTVSRAQITGFVHLRGSIRGENRLKLEPMTDIIESMTLEGHYYLDNVKVVDLLEAEDLIGPNGESYRTVRNDALPLNSQEIPVHMNFQSENVDWWNITVMESFENWITTKNSELNITGTKTVVGNLTLSQLSYHQLPLPVVSVKACAVGILTNDIYTTSMTMNNANVASLTADRIFGAQEMEKVFSDSVKSWDEVPWELKTITGEVKVKNASVSQVSNVNLPGLDESMARWSRPGVLNGPVRVKTLRITNLVADKGFSIPVPKTIKRFEALGNVNVTRFNGIDIQNFIDNAVEIDDMISLTNITFLGDLSVDNIISSTSNIPFISTLNGHFGSKTITGGFTTQHLIIPDVVPFPPADKPVQLTVTGNVIFVNEPNIENLNNFNLPELSKNIWMKNKPAKFKGKFIHLQNVTFQGPVDVAGELNTPNFGPWSKMGERIFSKSSDQKINQKMSFKTFKAINIIGSNTSKLISSHSTSLHDLEYNTLKKTGNQTISSSWSFEKIVIRDNIQINGVVNDLNLNNEILRTDVNNNVITGKIIADTLTARNIDGLKFHEFARNTLKTSNQRELVVIKGKKTFKNLKVKSLNLTSTIRGKRIESFLLKHSSQTIKGRKVIKGKLIAPGIITEGLINDVELTRLLVHQFKKNSPLQVIETPIVLQNGLNILGNLTIDKHFQGVDLNQLLTPKPSVLRLLNLSKQLLDYSHSAEGINLALQDRAFYFDKLELIEDNSTPLLNISDNKYVKFNCHIDSFLLYCNGTKIIDFSMTFNSSEVLELKAVTLDENSQIVCITTAPLGGISIYSLDKEKMEISREAELHIPDINQGSIATYMKSIWIVLGLQDNMMVLRYHNQEFQKHVISGSEHFALSAGLSDELLLFRGDGVWRLGGVAGPRLIFKVNLKGKIEVFNHGGEQYIQLNDGNTMSLLKAHYVGT